MAFRRNKPQQTDDEEPLSGTAAKQPHTAKTQAFSDINSQEMIATPIYGVTLFVIIYSNLDKWLGAFGIVAFAAYGIFMQIWYAYTSLSNDANAIVRNRRVYSIIMTIFFGIFNVLYIVASVLAFIKIATG